MKIEQFVMAYQVEQDRLRALLPEGFQSLRPVLRINAEVREGSAYIELNTAVEFGGKRGWLNIAHWDSGVSVQREGTTVIFAAPFLTISFTAVGIEGGCPAEKDNDGCFFLGDGIQLRPAEKISVNKEFCDCEFAWRFTENSTGGRSTGKTLPAYPTPQEKIYPAEECTAENAAEIPCEQVLGSYVVRFER